MAITDANLDPVEVSDPHPAAHNEERKAILDIIEVLENGGGGGAPIEPPIEFEILDEDVLLAELSTSINIIDVHGEGRLFLPETGVPGERYRFLIHNPQDLNIFINDTWGWDEDLGEYVWIEEIPGWPQVWVWGEPSEYDGAADVVYLPDLVDPEDPEPSVSGSWIWTWMKLDDGYGGGGGGGGDYVDRLDHWVATVTLLHVDHQGNYHVGNASNFGQGWGPRPGEYCRVELEFYHTYARLVVTNVANFSVLDGWHSEAVFDFGDLWDRVDTALPGFNEVYVNFNEPHEQVIPIFVYDQESEDPNATHIRVAGFGYFEFSYETLVMHDTPLGTIIGGGDRPVKITLDYAPVPQIG